MTYLIALGREARAKATRFLEDAGWCALHLALRCSTAVKIQRVSIKAKLCTVILILKVKTQDAVRTVSKAR